MKEKNSNFIELQKKYENTESILEKLRLENMKKTNEILKLKKDLEIFRKKENNTSSEFPYPTNSNTDGKQQSRRCSWILLI
jgi:hypothetical protein